MQLADFDMAQAAFLEIEMELPRGDGAHMSGVEEEIASENSEAVGVGRFDCEDATGCQFFRDKGD